MNDEITGESLAELLKNLANRIQTNNSDTEGILVELRQVADELEHKDKYGNGNA